mgnify:CR=1 FL=1
MNVELLQMQISKLDRGNSTEHSYAAIMIPDKSHKYEGEFSVAQIQAFRFT